MADKGRGKRAQSAVSGYETDDTEHRSGDEGEGSDAVKHKAQRGAVKLYLGSRTHGLRNRRNYLLDDHRREVIQGRISKGTADAIPMGRSIAMHVARCGNQRYNRPSMRITSGAVTALTQCMGQYAIQLMEDAHICMQIDKKYLMKDKHILAALVLRREPTRNMQQFIGTQALESIRLTVKNFKACRKKWAGLMWGGDPSKKVTSTTKSDAVVLPKSNMRKGSTPHQKGKGKGKGKQGRKGVRFIPEED